MGTCEVLLLGMTQEKSSERLPKSGMETGKREYGRAGGSGNSNRTRFQCRMIFLRFSPYKWLIKFCSCVEFKEKRTELAPYTSTWARLQRSSNTELAHLTIWRLHDVVSNCTIGLSCVSLFLRCPELFIAPCKEIWNLGNLCLWNPKYSGLPITRTFKGNRNQAYKKTYI